MCLLTSHNSEINDYSYIYHIEHGLGHIIYVIARDLGQTLTAFSCPSSNPNVDATRSTNMSDMCIQHRYCPLLSEVEIKTKL